ncbi:hypothetical protein [Paenibacillus glacialis]|uniref:Uncharacterized protein n=1 Tax=Paenibacillus glacialis TaxID=494026 RepID=A0A168NMP6_9BACL|nr:hypothetical protein [Paenibacillus glacialis]OAB45945.1 hypothetical protein PGLA_00680 [Paenibacillus glacialis]
MYIANIKATYTWNHSYIYATGADSVFLLIEWNMSELNANRTPSVSKLYARDVELNIWLEPGIKVVRTYGCKGVLGPPQSSLILSLGHLYTDKKQSVVIECSFKPHFACKRPVISVQWRYKGSNNERMKEQAVEEIYMNYTYNLGLLRKTGNFKVEKQVKLLKTSTIMKEAIEIYELGDPEYAEFILRRKGDELLLCAVQSGDMSLIEEAEKLYRIIEIYGGT